MLKQKLNQFKNFIQETYHTYPHVFLLGGFVLLAFGVSLANDSYFESVFKQSRPQIRPPEVIQPVYMKILSVEPESGVKQSFDTFMQFTMLFSENLDPTSIKITSSPEHPLGYELQGNKLRVFPRANWEFDLGYRITVDAKSTGGLVLEEPYVYSMYIATPVDNNEFKVY